MLMTETDQKIKNQTSNIKIAELPLRANDFASRRAGITF